MIVRFSPANMCIILAQIAVGIAALAMLALAPPAHGAMLLVPLMSDAPAARLARDSHALLLEQGPAGSLVVLGDRQTLFWPLLRAGVLAVAAPVPLCGEASDVLA
ncbi:hypothetical protein [Sphingomonas jeddahensis]|uniref:Uncharacterized protein n=1 Tax=Sphingomonas jeddahensis TaxID=1915074 RepID=A0A1V2ET16_9SPHN|nr:hypothetical protein [Sphingomonas jeddahensis]ONF95625.1 hypothetical protein SPHI_22920 [Sphingomonas jeddahensis]